MVELGEVLRQGAALYRARYTPTVAQDRVLRELPACRTPLLGGHTCYCDDCGHTVYRYHSCTNRHCPKCGDQQRQAWYQERLKDVLPTEYFHVVFTLPQPLADLAELNPDFVYDTLFQAASRAVLDTAAHWSGLRAKTALTAILHSWGEQGNLHPHLHCLVPGGGVSLDTGQWVHLQPGCFLPERWLRTTFRDTYLKLLRKAYRRRELRLEGPLARLQDSQAFEEWAAGLQAISWITFARSASNGARDQQSLERTVKYLARYANRIAISNHRIVACDGQQVTFTYKDYRRDGNSGKRHLKTLPIVEFIRRFLQHVFPNGKRRIRHYGFLSNVNRKQQLPEIRRLCGLPPEPLQDDPPEVSIEEELDRVEQESRQTCPECGRGTLVITETWERPSVADIMAIPWRELDQYTAMQLE